MRRLQNISADYMELQEPFHYKACRRAARCLRRKDARIRSLIPARHYATPAPQKIAPYRA